ncbi:MAG: hypothetical protein ACLQU2_35455 [Candidatus Binataceae bacterium]
MLYRIAKWFEKQFLVNSDVVVSLTDAGVKAMQEFDYLKGQPPRFAVITTCTDLEKFRPHVADGKPLSRKNSPFTIGYLGGTGLWYVFEPAVECFRILLANRGDARVLILNRGEHVYIRSCLTRRGVPLSRVEIAEVDHLAVAERVCRMHAAVYFIKPVFSKIASVPTKLGELLGCGVPCLTNARIGDVDPILRGEGVGVVIRGFSDDAIREGVTELLRLSAEDGIAERCRNAAVKHFSLDSGVRAYDNIYRALASDSGTAAAQEMMQPQ